MKDGAKVKGEKLNGALGNTARARSIYLDVYIRPPCLQGTGRVRSICLESMSVFSLGVSLIPRDVSRNQYGFFTPVKGEDVKGER